MGIRRLRGFARRDAGVAEAPVFGSHEDTKNRRTCPVRVEHSRDTYHAHMVSLHFDKARCERLFERSVIIDGA